MTTQSFRIMPGFAKNMSANSTNGFPSSLKRVSGALLLQRNDPFVGQRRGIAERRTDGFARNRWSSS